MITLLIAADRLREQQLLREHFEEMEGGGSDDSAGEESDDDDDDKEAAAHMRNKARSKVREGYGVKRRLHA